MAAIFSFFSLQELKRIVKRCDKEYKTAIQAKLGELTKDHKRAVREEGVDKKVSERQKKKCGMELLTTSCHLLQEETRRHKAESVSVENRMKTDFEASAATFSTAAMRIFRAEQEIEEGRLKFNALTEVGQCGVQMVHRGRLIMAFSSQELEMKQDHKTQRVALSAEHKTRGVHELYRKHLRQQQEVRELNWGVAFLSFVSILS